MTKSPRRADINRRCIKRLGKKTKSKKRRVAVSAAAAGLNQRRWRMGRGYCQRP
ncbi:hypothetical protein AG1IA_02443 [Rhizoctonia solani AG-1 IA]|uniref:Uncharacterized protein n=1 Tax=Thanatephorus cucumeris (strain AG1-IA) TaxID=983506 RepID=L8X340_THACA|nr:hypothetical protein AG1IA_02443 [Rhizoctonia solani AG-1 IA]